MLLFLAGSAGPFVPGSARVMYPCIFFFFPSRLHRTNLSCSRQFSPCPCHTFRRGYECVSSHCPVSALLSYISII